MERSRFKIKAYIWSGGWRLLLGMPSLFMALFFYYPLLTIFDVSLRPGGVWDFSGFIEIASSNYYRQTFVFTTLQALASTGITVLLALPCAYVFARYRFVGRGLLLSLATLAFVMPTVVVAMAFSALIGPRGVLNELLKGLLGLESPPIQAERTLFIILLVHVFYNFAVAFRIIASYWSNQSRRIEESARVLGCYGWRLWWEIYIPTLRPAITAASVLVFIFTFTSFGVILILGGPRYATIEVEIYYQAINFLNLPVAAALSIAQIMAMVVLMMLYNRLQKRIRTEWQPDRQLLQRPTSLVAWVAVGGVVLCVMLLIVAPLLALVWRALTLSGTFSLHYFGLLSDNPRGSILFVAPIEAIFNSLRFAVITMILSLVLGLPAAYLLHGARPRWSRGLDVLFMLPLATSAVTLGFGFLVALDEPPLNLRTSWVIIPIAHTIIALPFVVRSILPAINSVQPSLRESARVLGASSWQVWRWVDLPLISRGLWVALIFAFTVSMGEFGASNFIARSDIQTIPLVIYRLLGQPGTTNLGQALAMSVLLLLVCLAGFIIIERLRTIGIGEL